MKHAEINIISKQSRMMNLDIDNGLYMKKHKHMTTYVIESSLEGIICGPSAAYDVCFLALSKRKEKLAILSVHSRKITGNTEKIHRT